MAKRNVESMDKSALRAACKTAGISYSKLTVAAMREALLPKQAPAPVVITTPAPEPLVLVGVMAVNREVRANVKRPAPESRCGLVWAALDSMHAAGVVPTVKDARDLATAKSWNVNNTQTEMYLWKKWMGLSCERCSACASYRRLS